jgi:uncharacterized membrane-anchored protein
MRPLRIALLLACIPWWASAQQMDILHDPEKVPEDLAAIAKLLHPQTGTVTLGNGLATLTLPEGAAYLSPDDTNMFLHRMVGFTAEAKTLGAIVSTTPPIGSPASWYTLLTYEESGHVSDNDARALNANELLADMKAGNKQHNAQLVKAGFSTLTTYINGWAAMPEYDSSTHALSWGFDTKITAEAEPKVVYSFRFLGRKGVLTLVIAGREGQAPMLDTIRPQLVSAIRFNAPNRYEDFAAGDKNAPYGFTYMITGYLPPHTADNSQHNAPENPPLKWFAVLLLLAGLGIYMQKRKKSE